MEAASPGSTENFRSVPDGSIHSRIRAPGAWAVLLVMTNANPSGRHRFLEIAVSKRRRDLRRRAAAWAAAAGGASRAREKSLTPEEQNRPRGNASATSRRGA
jgi:hypothetical protein